MQRNKHVLMLAYPFPPMGQAGSFRMLRFVKYLPSFGWTPLVVTIRPDFVPEYARDEGLSHEIPSGTILRRTRVLKPVKSMLRFGKWIELSGGNTEPVVRRESGPHDMARDTGQRSRVAMRKAIDLLFATPDTAMGWIIPSYWASLSLIRRYRPDVIFSTGPPHSAHLTAILLKLSTGIPAIIDLRDPWARTQWDRGDGSSCRQRLQQAAESLCVRRSSYVVLNTSELLAEFRDAYNANLHNKFRVITNGFDPCHYGRTQQNEFSSNGSSDRNTPIRLCHPGEVYGKRDLSPLLSAIATLRKSGIDVRFEQVGAVDNEATLIRLVKSLGLDDVVTLCGQVSHAETLERMKSASGFIVSQPGTKIQVPSKLFEMMPFNRPILALAEAHGATAAVVKRYNLGSVVPPSDTEAIAHAIAELARPKSRSEFDTEAINRFDGRELSGRLAELLDEAIEEFPKA